MRAFIAAPFASLARVPRARAPRRPRVRLAGALTGLALSACAFAPPSAALADASSSCRAAATRAAASLADLGPLPDIAGNEIPPAAFAGRVVFAMNVASACGYTKPGYELLARLTDRFPADDFVAVAIPCNSFGWQENGSPEEIEAFALARAQRLVITERSAVNGDKAHPIVQLGKDSFPGRISWNFDGRYVFDRQGKPVARFGNGASAEEIEAAIEKAM